MARRWKTHLLPSFSHTHTIPSFFTRVPHVGATCHGYLGCAFWFACRMRIPIGFFFITFPHNFFFLRPSLPPPSPSPSSSGRSSLDLRERELSRPYHMSRGEAIRHNLRQAVGGGRSSYGQVEGGEGGRGEPLYQVSLMYARKKFFWGVCNWCI